MLDRGVIPRLRFRRLRSRPRVAISYRPFRRRRRLCFGFRRVDWENGGCGLQWRSVGIDLFWGLMKLILSLLRWARGGLVYTNYMI